MSELDPARIAMVVAKPGGQGARAGESVGTGYFLTGNLVLTAGHVADWPDSTFRVRADTGGPEKDAWSDAKAVWIGDVDVDAMLLRTDRRFGEWKPPSFVTDKDSGTWKSFGYPRSAADDENDNRKTLPLKGSFDTSGGQGPRELALRTEDIVSPKDETSWEGISGAPVFTTCSGEDDGLVGIITDARRMLSNSLIGLPAKRLFEDISFRSEIYPSFLGSLPELPFCLVLSSEGASSGLVKQAAFVLTKFRDDEAQFERLHEEPVSIQALEAVRSPENWAATVNALARARYLIADVTSFQPVVMVLLGIRAVLRRGVTISVTEKQHDLSETVPFNVQETKVLSYESEEFDNDLHRAMAEGFTNLGMDPNYLDLPAYNAVRAPRPVSWATDDHKNVIVLCPFGPAYSSFYRKELRKLIQNQTKKSPLRMLDLRSPRLVGQALYEQIRWSSWCLVDWTGWRANVFFELGVRLACSERDPLCVIQRSCAEGNPAPGEAAPGPLEQHDLLLKLLEPVVYDPEDPDQELDGALSSWPPPPQPGRPKSPSGLPAGATFQVAQASFDWERDSMLTSPHIEQRRAAELIFAADQEQDPEPLVLFGYNKEFNAELQAAVKEKWIAAWLYLQHISTADDDSPRDDNPQLATVASLVDQNLKDSDNPRHIRLQKDIKAFLDQRRSHQSARENDSSNG